MMRRLVLASVALLIGGGPACAHIVSSRLGDFYGGALHPLTGLADAILWLALGMVAAAQPARWARWLVLVFPAGLLAGLGVGLASGWTADPVTIDAALMVTLGLLTVAAVRLPGPLLLALAFALAAFRGVANASGVEAGTDATLFACGLATAGYASITLVTALGSAFRRSGVGWQAIAVRAGGSWIAAIGLMVGGYALATG